MIRAIIMMIILVFIAHAMVNGDFPVGFNLQTSEVFYVEK